MINCIKENINIYFVLLEISSLAVIDNGDLFVTETHRLFIFVKDEYQRQKFPDETSQNKIKYWQRREWDSNPYRIIVVSSNKTF